MDTTPLVTVIIATYNRSNILRYSVGSALNQSYKNIEVLVIGDGCTDDSQAVIENMNDNRLRWIGLPENSGHQSTPNNIGLSEASGEYIAYLGHDDIWLPHHLHSCIEVLNHGYGLVYGLFLIIHPNKSMVLVAGNTPTTPTTVVHRKILTDKVGGWRHHKTINSPPDMDLWGRIHKAGFKRNIVPRLSTIKIHAAIRKDVYKTRRSDEQEYWFNRIQNEPDLEAVMLGKGYLEVSRRIQKHEGTTGNRRTNWKKGEEIESLRRYKGL